MSYARRFAVAAALAASRIIPRDVPVLGSLAHSSLVTLSTAAVLAAAFVDLAQRDGPRPARRRRAAAQPARPYEEWTRDQLYRRAQELGLEGRSRLNKVDLIAALRRYD
jgi:hypothetical protein